eukprot:jgi/Mesen1/10172/ME000076S09679
MDPRWRQHAMDTFNGQKREREEAYEDSLRDDDMMAAAEFVLPIGHRIENNLDRSQLEQASMDAQIPSTNVGFRLLQRMGWKAGTGLGRQQQGALLAWRLRRADTWHTRDAGIVEPVRADVRDQKLGVGKQEQDDFYTAEENVARKKLALEVEETPEQTRKREAGAEKDEKIRSEVSEIRRAFFCQLCSKQYKLAVEYETHLSSYDHNHKKRFKEMKDTQAVKGSRDERQKREQMRADKEMARMAALAEAQSRQQIAERGAPTSDVKAAPPAYSPAAGVVPPLSNPAATAAVPGGSLGGATAGRLGGGGLAGPGQRGVLKFGLGAKGKTSFKGTGQAANKAKLDKMASIFKADDSDEG